MNAYLNDDSYTQAVGGFANAVIGTNIAYGIYEASISSIGMLSSPPIIELGQQISQNISSPGWNK